MDLDKKKEIEKLLKQVEEKKLLFNQYIKKEEEMCDEIEKLLKKAEKIASTET